MPLLFHGEDFAKRWQSYCEGAKEAREDVEGGWEVAYKLNEFSGRWEWVKVAPATAAADYDAHYDLVYDSGLIRHYAPGPDELRPG